MNMKQAAIRSRNSTSGSVPARRVTKALGLGALALAFALGAPVASQAQVVFGVQVGGPVYRPVYGPVARAPYYPAPVYSGPAYVPRDYGYDARRDEWQEERRDEWRERQQAREWREDHPYVRRDEDELRRDR